MDPIRVGKLRAFQGGSNPLYKNEKERKWEKEWKDKGKLYSLSRGFNRAGGFLRLGVVDLERKRFRIFLPGDRRDKRGCTTMAEIIHQMEDLVGRRTNPQEVRVVGKSAPAKSYAEAVKRTSWKGSNAINVKVKREETAGNLQKLEHCIVASWKSNKKEEEDLERLGRFWANSWVLKGKLGLAKLEKGRALLEFEDLKEANRVVSSGSRVMGGIHLGLEHWNPKTGCWAEEEIENEVWVKILGLPISLWSPMILKRIGEECGGFVAIDERTKSMGEIQWARLLVKTRGDFRPSVLEIEVEEEVYALSLWWEIRPVVRRIFTEAEDRRRNEVRGDMNSRAEKHVGKEPVGARLEKMNLPDDGRFLQEKGLGLEPGNRIHGLVLRDWAFTDGRVIGSSSSGPIVGLKEMEKAIGLAKTKGPLGLTSKETVKEVGGLEADPSSRRQALELGCHSTTELEGLERAGLIVPQEKASLLDRFISKNGSSSQEPLVIWEPEELRREQMRACFSMTNRALEEEAQRYDLIFHPKGKRVLGIPLLLSSHSDRAPEGESFDRLGGIEEEPWGDKSTWLTMYEGNAENENGSWKLGEANRNRDKVRGKEGNPGASEIQDTEKKKEEIWEDCNLAKFRQFLGFSTEGLEKEILSFLIKIRKRRENIHSKELLEKSKFERELKRLECFVNYEGENKQKGSSQGKGNQMVVVQ